jgi:ribulose-phosphate 3-epimerase
MKISASLICSNPLYLGKDIDELVASDIDSIHFDIMDGNFVPRFGLYPEIIVEIRKKYNLSIDVHMMNKFPERYVTQYADLGVNYYSFHIETTPHADFLLNKIASHKMKPGIALNPGTSINSLDYLIEKVDIVILMAINPGILGQKINPLIYKKISALRDMANSRGNRNLIIQIDGGVTFETAPLLIAAGSNSLVCGTGTIFRPNEDTISNKIKALLKII